MPVHYLLGVGLAGTLAGPLPSLSAPSPDPLKVSLLISSIRMAGLIHDFLICFASGPGIRYWHYCNKYMQFIEKEPSFGRKSNRISAPVQNVLKNNHSLRKCSCLINNFYKIYSFAAAGHADHIVITSLKLNLKKLMALRAEYLTV